MMRAAPLAMMAAALWLAACQTSGVPEAPARANLAQDVVRLTEPGPPKGPEGACWASDVMPGGGETGTRTGMESAEQRGPEGAVLAPAVVRSDTHQAIVQPRDEVWFRSPCPDQLTPDLIASLQRALKARGLYLVPLTGEMDAPTREAVRRFQSDRGLDSDQLSLAAARVLGLVVTDVDQL